MCQQQLIDETLLSSYVIHFRKGGYQLWRAIARLLVVRFSFCKSSPKAKDPYVMQIIFACRKISRIPRYSRNFPAREYFLLYSILFHAGGSDQNGNLSFLCLSTVNQLNFAAGKFRIVPIFGWPLNLLNLKARKISLIWNILSIYHRNCSLS